MRHHPTRFMTLTLIALGILGAGLIFYSTPYGGLGVSPDSVHYFAAARSLRMGEGWIRFSDNAYTSWPPLYSALLMVASELGGVFNLAPLESARILHAMTYALIILLSGVLFRRSIRSSALVVLATVAVLGSLPLLQASVFVWSEAIFIALALLLLLGLQRYVERPSWRLFAALVVVAGLAGLQRYMAITLIAAGSLCLLLFATGSWARRIALAVGFGALSFAPLGVWLLGNALSTGEMAGPRPPSEITTLDGASRASDTVMRWLFPHPYPSGYFPLGLLIILTICAALILLAFRKRQYSTSTNQVDSSVTPLSWQLERGVALSALFVIVYPAMLLTFHSLITLNEIANRDLVPIYPFLIAVLFALLERVTSRLASRFGQPRLARVLVAGIAGVWLVAHPLRITAAEVTAFRTWCCQLEAWNAIDTVQWMRDNPLARITYTNDPMPLYTIPLSQTRLIALPEDLRAARRALRPGDYVAWFDESVKSLCSPTGRFCHDTDYAIDDLLPTLTPVADLGDGAVYVVRGGQ